jgi:hypothetical protein
MTLTLIPTMTVAAVQAEFAAYFSYLKIEFFTLPHKEGGTIWSKYQVFDPKKTLAQVSNLFEPKQYDFTLETTVGKFEQDLQNLFGIYVQIFRRSMGSWIATSATDAWTLDKQNKMGEESAHTVVEMIYEPHIADG